MSNQTQPLPDDTAQDSPDSNPTHPLWQWLSRPRHLPRATQFGLAVIGGACTVVGASIAMNWAIEGAGEIRSLPQSQQTTAPIQMSADEFAAEQAQTEIAAGDVQVLAPPLVLVEGANADGSGLKDFPTQTGEDRARLELRREDDRILREKWALEDRKRNIERELEKQELAERHRQDNLRLEREREDEQRRRIESRLDEDRRMLEERTKNGEQLAAAD